MLDAVIGGANNAGGSNYTPTNVMPVTGTIGAVVAGARNALPGGGASGGGAGSGAGGTGGAGGYVPVNYSAQALANIQSQMNQLNAREGMYRGDIDAQYGVRRAGLDVNKGQGMQNLDRQRQTETRQKDMSIRDLANNIRNSYQAGMQRLGVQGAGDSSATGMYKYALGQLEGQNRGQIVDNYQFNQGNIDLAVKQLEQNYSQKILELDDWKRSQVLAIADKFQNARDQLNAQIGQLGSGTVSQQQAQLAAQTAAQLANVSATVTQASRAVQDNFAQAAAELRAYNQNNMTPNTQFQTGPTQNEALQVANPTLYKKYNE